MSVKLLDDKKLFYDQNFVETKVKLLPGIAGRRMENPSTGKFTTTECLNKGEEALWSLSVPELRILVSVRFKFLIKMSEII